MKLLIILFITSSFLFSQKMNIQELEKNIKELYSSVEGEFALAFVPLFENGESLYINEKENFHAASTMKTPVMLELFKQAEERKLNLDDSIIVNNLFKSIVDSSEYSMRISEDSGEGLYTSIGKIRTYRELIFDMITVSSNLATNILIEVVGAKNVMQTMKEIGANDIQVLRGVEDLKAFELGLNNTTTAYDLALIYKVIAEKKFLSEKSHNEMIEILLSQKFRSQIPAKLPKEVKVAHKTGSITGVQHDSGIIYLPNGSNYILILLSKKLKKGSEGIDVHSQVSKLIYDFVLQN